MVLALQARVLRLLLWGSMPCATVRPAPCRMQTRFPDYGLKYSIGGQISFDVFPIGWDKVRGGWGGVAFIERP